MHAVDSVLREVNIQLLKRCKMDCKQFFKQVILKSSAIVSQVDVDTKTIKSEYSNTVCKELSEILKTSALKVDYSNPGKNAIQTVVKCLTCPKKYKFKLFWDSMKKDGDLVLDIYTNDSECKHPENQQTRPVKGKERVKVAQDLKQKSIKSYANQKLDEVDLSLLKATGNSQSFKSSEVYRKIRSEEKAQDDLHRNDLYDVYLKATNDENLKNPFIQKVTLYPFSVEVCYFLKIKQNNCKAIFQLFSEESLRLLIQERKKNKTIRVYMDATGGLVGKPDTACPAVMNHVIILRVKSNESNNESILYPIAELITCDQTSLNLELFLRRIISKLNNLTTVFQNIANFIVVDWSFAEFNAIIKSQLMTFQQYLDKMFEATKSKDTSNLENLTIIASCSSHLTKIVVKDVRYHYKDKNDQNAVIDLVMEIMSCSSFDILDQHIRNLLILLKKPTKDAEYNECCQQMDFNFKNTLTNVDLDDVAIDDENFRELYKTSKFFKKYDAIYQSIKISGEGAANPYCNDNFAKILLKKFISFLPFFGGPFMKIDDFCARANNGSVEKYFAMEKRENRARNNNVLVGEKIGRFINYRKESDRLRLIRIKYKIQTNCLAQSRRKPNLDSTKDNWKGKSSSKYHTRKHSKKAIEEACETLNQK